MGKASLLFIVFFTSGIILGMWVSDKPSVPISDNITTNSISTRPQLQPQPKFPACDCPTVATACTANEQLATENTSNNDTLAYALEHSPELGEKASLAFSAAVDKLQTDAKARQNLLLRLSEETNPDTRSRMLSMLLLTDSKDVKVAARTLTQSNEPSERRDGFTLLQTDGSQAAQNILINAIENEWDDEALSNAIYALQAHQHMPPDLSQRVTQRLKDLSTHQHADVRAATLISLGGAGNTANITDIILSGLTDQDTSVQEAAMSAIGESRARTPELKQELFRLAFDNNVNEDLRNYAADLLKNFPLEHNEYDTLQAKYFSQD